jgi:hypothetical protein
MAPPSGHLLAQWHRFQRNRLLVDGLNSATNCPVGGLMTQGTARSAG